jgi:uncharacterized glyoxalase superfamily protein PhnB
MPSQGIVFGPAAAAIRLRHSLSGFRCQSDDQQPRLFESLFAGGHVFMPLANYGFSKSFAWISDRFDVSWQLNLE